MNLEIIANCSAKGNKSDSSVIVDSAKLPTIYCELRKKVFINDPIQENSGDNGLYVFSHYYPFLNQGNYGWQLFKTPKGTALIEYLGPIRIPEAQRKPLALHEERHLVQINITFHQQEDAFEEVKRIVEEQTELARMRLKAS